MLAAFRDAFFTLRANGEPAMRLRVVAPLAALREEKDGADDVAVSGDITNWLLLAAALDARGCSCAEE